MSDAFISYLRFPAPRAAFEGPSVYHPTNPVQGAIDAEAVRIEFAPNAPMMAGACDDRRERTSMAQMLRIVSAGALECGAQLESGLRSIGRRMPGAINRLMAAGKKSGAERGLAEGALVLGCQRSALTQVLRY